MDEVGTMRDAFDKVNKRQNLFQSLSQVVFDRVCETILETLFRIHLDCNGVIEETEPVLSELRVKLDSLLEIIKLQGSQSEMNIRHSTFEKLLDDSCHLDRSLASYTSIDFDIRVIDKMLVDYFYQQGLFEVGDCLVKEAKVEVETEVKAQSLELHRLVESMKLKDIEPAMGWISTNCGNMEQKGSKLEMKLISLKYRDMVRDGDIDDAVEYGREHFSKYFALGFDQELEELTMALLWYEDFEKSPYAEVLSPSHWDKVTNELTNQYYNLLDQPSNSPLEVTLSAGLDSLPTLPKAMEELSIFVCPLSRDESNEENPPMMMPCCFHVLCKESIMKLGQNHSFKCPHCSAKASASTCLELHF